MLPVLFKGLVPPCPLKTIVSPLSQHRPCLQIAWSTWPPSLSSSFPSSSTGTSQALAETSGVLKNSLRSKAWYSEGDSKAADQETPPPQGRGDSGILTFACRQLMVKVILNKQVTTPTKFCLFFMEQSPSPGKAL